MPHVQNKTPTKAFPTQPVRRGAWQGVTGQRTNGQSFDGTATRAWRMVPHWILGAAAEVHSQLRLGVTPLFTRVQMMTVKDTVHADCLAEEIKALLEKKAIAEV